MGLAIIAALGVVVVGYYVINKGGGFAGFQSAAGSGQPGLIFARTTGPQPGTIPAGVSLPGQSAEGPGPNTSGAIVTTAAGFGAGLVAMAGTTAGVTALGAATLGIGAVVGIGLALWMAHAARVKGAKDENAVLNELVPNFSNCLQKEFAALNAGQVSPTTALQDLEGIRTTYWQAIAPYQKGPGQHTHPCNPLTNQPDSRGNYYAPQANCSQTNKANRYSQATVCDNSCTAGCCIGCDYVEPAICSAKYLIQSGGGTMNFPSVAGSKYGYSGQSAFSVNYTPSAVPGGNGFGLW
jgi:hypothetical protein